MKEELRLFLRTSKDVFDIILFGSYVKGKTIPEDIDIAVISKTRESKPLLELRHKLKRIEKRFHLELIPLDEIYKNPLWTQLTLEGYSLKENKYLKNLLGIKPMKLYRYNLTSFPKSEKVQFHRGLNRALEISKGKRLGPGVILIPFKMTGYVEEFFDRWKLKYKVEEIKIIS